MEPLTCFYRVAPLSLPRRWCWPLVLDGLSCSAPLPLLPWQPDANLLSCQTEASSTHTVPGRAGQAKNAGCAPWKELPHLHIDLLNLMNWIFFFFLFFFTKYTLFILTIFSFCCFLKLIFIGIELLYNVVLVSTVQQSEPALSSVHLLSRVQLFETPWTAAHQASLSFTNCSRSLLKLMSIELVMPPSHLILCCPLLLPSVFPSIGVFSNESAIRIRWPKYWSFSFNISPSNEYSGLISFRMDWLDLFAVQGMLSSLLQCHGSKTSILRHSAFFIVQLSHAYMTTGKTIALTRQTFVGKVMSLLFNILSRFVIAFLPRSKRLLISWLQSPSAVILELKKITSCLYTYILSSLDFLLFVLSHFSRVWLFVTLWTTAHQAPLSLRFSRQEYWSGLTCPPPGYLLNPGIEPASPASP